MNARAKMTTSSVIHDRMHDQMKVIKIKWKDKTYLVSTSLVVFFAFSLKQMNEIKISDGIRKQKTNKQKPNKQPLS